MKQQSRVYVIQGDPTPLARPRMGNGNVWDSQKALKFNFGVQINLQHKDEPFFEGPLLLDVSFYFDISKVAAKKRPILNETYHRFVPDLSNLIKLVEDAVIGVLYKDDCVISVITAKKLYSSIPRTEFTITELE